jgi:hypothetical protein
MIDVSPRASALLQAGLFAFPRKLGRLSMDSKKKLIFAIVVLALGLGLIAYWTLGSSAAPEPELPPTAPDKMPTRGLPPGMKP